MMLPLAIESPLPPAARLPSRWGPIGVFEPSPGISALGVAVVQAVLSAESIQPHRFRYWKDSDDPEFEPKMLAVVGLYLHPPQNAVVLSVDEKPSIQALDRTQPLCP